MKKISLWEKLFGKHKPQPDEPSTTQSIDGGESDSAVSAYPAAKPKFDPNPPLPGVSDQSPNKENTNDKQRVIRVFVSSTFRDMIEDRNELMAHAWPALRKICRERAVEFVEVDLRWGVTEEMTERKDTVRHCLAEIKRCRPYFIGLLAERYGWVPGTETFSDALLHEEGWLTGKVAKHSVTELEIMQGVMNDPDLAKRAFFYFRDPAYAQTKGGDYLAECESDAIRQQTLKENIRNVCQAKNIPLREGEHYQNPKTLAGLVLADLTPAINADFPDDQVPDVWVREARDHEAYAKSRRTRFYIGRDAYFQELDRFAENGDDGKGLVVMGESGGGKSALLANWVQHWRNAHPDDFVFQHYIGSSPMSAGHLALMRRVMVEIIRWCGEDVWGLGSGMGGFGAEEERLPAKADEIIKVFPDYLGRLAYRANKLGVKAVIVLDALNQLEDYEKGRLLGWLPYRMPNGIRLLVSTLPSDTLEALQPRLWPSLTVEPLTPEERVRLIAGYLNHFSQGLSGERAKRIAAAPVASNPLFIKTLLGDLRVTGDYDHLDDHINGYLQAEDIPALFGKILARYERDYEHDRPGLVSEALSLLWAARRGLTEPELLELLKPKDSDTLPTAYWTPLRYALAEGLVDRDGLLSFAHEHLRLAVERRYLSGIETAKILRVRLADYFEVQPVSARSCDELPWLLRQTKYYDRLKASLLDIERFLLIQQSNQNELMQYWVDMREERIMGQAYLDSFKRWERKTGNDAPQWRFGLIANQLGYFLNHAGLFVAAEPLYRQAQEVYERELGPEHPYTLNSINNLAELLRSKGDYAAAEPLCRRALAGREKFFGLSHPDTLQSINNLAELLRSKGDYAGAEPFCKRALETRMQVLGAEHPLTLVSLNNLAGLLLDQGNYAASEPLFRQALSAFGRVLGSEHPYTLGCLSNLGSSLYMKGDFVAAESLFRQALDAFKMTLGPVHPHTIKSISNVTEFLAEKGYITAEPLLREMLLNCEREFGSEHPLTLDIQIDLSILLRWLGRYAEASQLCKGALKIAERVLGSTHPRTLTCMCYLALILQDQGKLAEADHLCRRVLEGREHTLGLEHPDTLKSLSQLALLLYHKCDYVNAEDLYRRVLIRQEKVLGTEHPSTLETMGNLALLLQDQGKLAQAEPLCRRVLETRESILGSEHPGTLTSLHNMALLLFHMRDYANAESLFRKALVIHEKVLGSQHPSTLIVMNSLATLLKNRGKHGEAKGLYSKVLEIQDRLLEPYNPDTLWTLNNLAALLMDQGKYVEAEPLLLRSLIGWSTICQSAGHSHPNLEIAIDNYSEILSRMGFTPQQVILKLRGLTGR